MRVTDKLRFDFFRRDLQSTQEKLVANQAMEASGKKVNTPSDDSVIASKMVELGAEQQSDDQYVKNLESVRSVNGVYDTSLGTINDLLSQVKDLTISMASDSNNADTRNYAAREISGIIEHIVTVANSKVGNNYIFAGKKVTTAPFVLNDNYQVDFVGTSDVSQVYLDKGELGDYSISGAGLFSSPDVYSYPANTGTGTAYSNSAYKFGNERFLTKITTGGAPGTAEYKYSTDGGETWSAAQDTYVTSATASQYVITAGVNDRLIINDGVDHVVTLTAGTYSANGLAAEVKARMEASTAGSADTYTVSYSATTGKFTIQNDNTAANPGSLVLKTSDLRSSASGILGFDTGEDKTIDKGKSSTGDFLGGMFIDGAGIANDTNHNVKMIFKTPEFVVSENNRRLVFNDGTTDYTVALTTGTYSAAALAAEVKARMEAATAAADSYTVSYDDTTGKFSITNDNIAANPTNLVLKWSAEDTTAEALLGFEPTDTTLAKGATDTSDTAAEGTLLADDRFCSETNTFDVLRNLKEALEGNDQPTISKILSDLNTPLQRVEEKRVEVGTYGNKVDTIISEKDDRKVMFGQVTHDLVDADLSQLVVDFNTLYNTYQALMYSMAKMESLSILNYLK